MSINASLSINPLVNVTASLLAAVAEGQSTQTMLILGSSPVIDVVTRMQSFDSDTAVAQLFGSQAPETLAATVWFESQEAPGPVFIGRWAQTATAGQLFGSPLTVAQQAIAAWQAITEGGFGIAINGAAVEQIAPLNFSGAANMNGVAAVIQAKLTGATITWSAINNNFVITSATTGVTSSVGFAVTPTGGGETDISALLGLAATSSGAYVANGIAAESALAAATLFDATFGQQFYAMTILGAADTDHQVVGPFLAGTANKHFYQISTQEAGVLVSTSTTDIASVMQASTVSKTAVQYNGSSPYSGISLMATMLSVNYNGSNTVKAAMWQQEPGITPDALNANQLAAMLAKNCNGFLAYNNGSSIIQPGKCSNGQWIDAVIGADALVIQIQTDVFNFMLANYVPQTDAGNHMIKVTIENTLKRFRNNGYLTPGVWNGPLFGSLQNNADGTPPTLSKGFYVYQPPIASQPQAQLNDRISVPFQFAAKLAGAVGTVNVAGILTN